MKKDNRNAIIIGLLITIAFMSVGYALLSNKVNSNELKTSIANAYADVSISTITSVETQGMAEDAKSYINGNTEVVLYPVVREKGDKVIYTINIINNGTKKSELRGIDISPKQEDYEIYSIVNLSAGEELLPGESKMFEIEISYNNEYEQDSVDVKQLKEIKVTLDFTK